MARHTAPRTAFAFSQERGWTAPRTAFALSQERGWTAPRVLSSGRGTGEGFFPGHPS